MIVPPSSHVVRSVGPYFSRAVRSAPHWSGPKIRYNQVDLLSLPPNTTHLLQPLDKGIFGSLKIEWGKFAVSLQ